MTTVYWSDLGRCEYRSVLAVQRRLAAERLAGATDDQLLLVEHEPTITLGFHADEHHVLVGDAARRAMGIEAVRVERGGDVTYHGPGQQVLYPILDLTGYRKSVRWYCEALMATAVRSLAAFGIEGHARLGREAGVWVRSPTGRLAKIAAVGVRIRRWVTWHGLALNVDPDLDRFSLIVPCGLPGIAVTSMAAELARPVALAEVRPALLSAFSEVFDVTMAMSDAPVEACP